MKEKEQWDLIIRPRRSFLELNLLELWRYRDLLFMFVKRDFIASYKQTILGPLWLIINPLLTIIIFNLVFSRIAKIPTEGINPFVYYLTGLSIWNFFAHSVNVTSNTFLSNAHIFGKVYFPRLVVPLATVVAASVRFLIQFFLLFVLILYFKLKGQSIDISINIVFVPIIFVITAIMALGFGVIFSSLTTKYRDLTNLLSFGMQLWMYATPIIYPLTEAPLKYRQIILLNPMTGIVETFKFLILGKGVFLWSLIVFSVIFAILIFIIGVLIFNKVEESFMDYI